MFKRILLIAIFLLALCVAAGWYVYSIKFDADKSVRIYIPRDATETSVRDTLLSNLGKDYGEWTYRFWTMFEGKASRSAGSYVIEPDTRACQAARSLAHGWQSPVKVTINNMRTLDDMAKRLSSQLEARPEEFIKAIENDTTFNSLELYPAAFLPDTYEFYWNANPDYVIGRLIGFRNKFWNDERKAKAQKLGLTPEEVATVASIVEEESNRADERPIIARLYLNRLAKGMKLQADPTVKFAFGDFSLRRITNKHLQTNSPYNTYMYEGLPPGPIRIAEKSTLDAVLNAPANNYLYMCAKEDFSGRHNFAADYNTHLNNARRYHAALNKRGIK